MSSLGKWYIAMDRYFIYDVIYVKSVYLLVKTALEFIGNFMRSKRAKIKIRLLLY